VVSACVLSAALQVSAAGADVEPTPQPLLAGNTDEYCVGAQTTVRCWGWANAASDGSLGAPIGGISVDDGPITALSARLGDGCVLQRGTMRCWGVPFSGGSSSGAAKVDGIQNVVAIASGGDSAAACGVERAGTVRCFGYNSYGQLGNGTKVHSEVPITVPDIDDATDVSIGNEHGCALRSSGVPWCWGSNRWGQLGIGRADDQTHTPVRVPGVTSAVSITAGMSSTCVITVERTVQCWGYLGGAATVPNLSGVSQVAVGNGVHCALASGVVSCWGINSQGQLGRGTTGGVDNVPAPVIGLPSAAIAIAANHNSACALTAADGAWCWGGNQYRELGNNTMTSSNAPVRVKFSGQWPPVLSTISGPGPITSISTSGELACNATHAELTAPVFAVDVALPLCGLYVWGARGLAGPDTWGAQSSGQAWLLVSHSESGDGSFASPRTSTVVARNATLQIVATVTNTYVDGDDRYRTTVRLANEQATPQSFHVVHAATCNLPHPVDPIATRISSSCYSAGYGSSVSITPGAERPASLFTMGAADLRPALAARGVGTVTPRHGAPTIGARWAVDLAASGEQTVSYTTRIRAKRVDGVIATDGPFTEISTTPDLRCGRNPKVSATPPFLANYSCGTWVMVDGSLFGPDADQMQPGWPQPASTWIPVDQSEAGHGTADDPWEITTEALGADKVAVEQTDRYVDGAAKTSTQIKVTNTSVESQDVVVSAAGDCVHTDEFTGLFGTQGFGWRSASDILTGGTGCSDKAYSGTTLTWRSQGQMGHFSTNTPESISQQITAGKEFDDQCRCAIRMDDAAGLSWSATLAPGASVTLSYDLALGTGDAEQPAPPPGLPPSTDGASIPWNMNAIGAPAAWGAQPTAVTGTGQTVAIVDTGIDYQHAWFAGRIDAEACRSTELHRPGVLSPGLPLLKGTCPRQWTPPDVLADIIDEYEPDIPGADLPQIDGLTVGARFDGLHAAEPLREGCTTTDNIGPIPGIRRCDGFGVDKFLQGTFVAGLAAGHNPTGVGGVAPDAKIIAANVSSFRSGRVVMATPGDAASALAWVDAQRKRRKIAAVSLMLPGRMYSGDRTGYAKGACSGNSPALEHAITTLTNHNITVVVAAGDEGLKNQLPWPACLPNVISVGATDSADKVVGQSNSSPQLTMLAPGGDVRSAYYSGRDERDHDATSNRSGTYAAAAHVVGAIALYKQKYPTAAAYQVKRALIGSGIATKDTNGIAKPRLRVDSMLKIKPTG